MKNAIAIAQKELKSFFISPIAYVVLMIFLVLSGYFFYTNLLHFKKSFQYYQYVSQIYRNPEMLSRLNLNSMVISNILLNCVFVLLFLIPIIMMRSFAEEKKNSTEELLMTSPVTTNQIVAGKFIGSLGFILALILPTIIYQVLLFKMASSPPELGPVITGYLGLISFSIMAITIGLFASSLTNNQIIAAVVCFVLLFMLFIVGSLDLGAETVMGQAISFLSVTDHLKNPIYKGVLDSRDFIYFGAFSVLFLFLTKQSVESVRWR